MYVVFVQKLSSKFHISYAIKYDSNMTAFLAFCLQSSCKSLVLVYLEQLQWCVSPTINFVALICASIVTRSWRFWISSYMNVQLSLTKTAMFLLWKYYYSEKHSYYFHQYAWLCTKLKFLRNAMQFPHPPGVLRWLDTASAGTSRLLLVEQIVAVEYP